MSENENTRRPHLQVNVIATGEAAKHLRTILARFRDGSTEPLVFGDGNKPEAAVISFADYMRFRALEQDAHDSEQTFQAELQRRSASTERLEIDSVEDFADSLGDAGRTWARDRSRRSDDA